MNEIIFGINTIQSVINVNTANIKKIFITNKYVYNNRLIFLYKKIKEKNIPIYLVNSNYLKNKSNNKNHQGIIAEISPTKIYNENYLTKVIHVIKNNFILVLDSIVDPHNFGACLRSANAAGVNMVIIPKNRSSKINGTVRKVASGAIDTMTIVAVTNLSRTLNFLKLNNIWIIGSSHKAKFSLFDTKMNHPAIAIVVGSEENGMRYLTSKICDEIIKVPMFGDITSLNVSVTTGIILFETVRQRILKKIDEIN